MCLTPADFGLAGRRSRAGRRVRPVIGMDDTEVAVIPYL
jgi:hypothetical protein